MKTIVIAGGNKGLGLEIALNFDSHENKIFLLARNNLELEEAKKRFSSANVYIYSVDLSNSDETESVFKNIANHSPEIDLLVNAAATWMGKQPIRDQDPKVIMNSVSLNFMTAYNSIHYCLNIFPESKPCIINLGATASHRGSAEHSAFAIGKTSLRILSESLAREESINGIHVVHVTIDGLLFNDRTKALNEELTENQYIKMSSAAKTIISAFEQTRDCWTFELDLRPYNEKF